MSIYSFLPISVVWLVIAIFYGCSTLSSQSPPESRIENAPQALWPPAANESDDLRRMADLWQQRKQQKSAGDYPIGPGDVLQINVAGMEEIKDVSQRVTGEGTISLPFAGVIHASGMTDKMLTAEIRRRLETNYMRNPQISLFVKEFRSRQVAVIGAVQKPGLYNLASSADRSEERRVGKECR